MPDRLPSLSNNLPTIRAKDDERNRIQADIDAFLRKRGNRIQVLAPGECSRPLQLNYHQVNDQMAALTKSVKADRRRRPKDEDE